MARIRNRKSATARPITVSTDEQATVSENVASRLGLSADDLDYEPTAEELSSQPIDLGEFFLQDGDTPSTVTFDDSFDDDLDADPGFSFPTDKAAKAKPAKQTKSPTQPAKPAKSPVKPTKSPTKPSPTKSTKSPTKPSPKSADTVAPAVLRTVRSKGSPYADFIYELKRSREAVWYRLRRNAFPIARIADAVEGFSLDTQAAEGVVRITHFIPGLDKLANTPDAWASAQDRLSKRVDEYDAYLSTQGYTTHHASVDGVPYVLVYLSENPVTPSATKWLVRPADESDEQAAVSDTPELEPANS